MPERHLCIVPVRAGSKSIKNKNLLKLNGRTLVDIAVDKAVNSNEFNHIVVTTDYSKHELGIQGNDRWEYWRRPLNLCQDDSLAVDVVMDVLRSHGGYQWIWLWQVTSPFTSIADVKTAKKLIHQSGTKSLITVKEVTEHPNRMYTISEGSLCHLRHSNFENKQDLIKVYIRSGNLYVARVEEFIAGKSFYVRPCVPLEIPRDRGTNLDAEEDFATAKRLLMLGKVRIV